jgi:hypothetical protein
LSDLSIESRVGVSVAAIEASGATLVSGGLFGLLGAPMLALHIDWYITVLDLGTWGAVYTEGWDRTVVSTGEAAKRTKQTINCRRIYPPLSGNPREILDAAAPLVQAAPTVYPVVV